MQISGRERFLQALRRALASKADYQDVIPGMTGRRGPSGDLELEVDNAPGYAWVRIRGQESEPVRAWNEQIGLVADVAVLLARDPYQPRSYRIIGKDAGKYQGWDFPLLPKHGDQHSFSSVEAAGRDPVFVYKRQLAQPLLVHPQETPDMTVYVEADYYFWNGSYHYFAGSNSADLTSLQPSAGLSRFVLIYLDGPTGTILASAGATFSSLVPPSDRIDYIPTVGGLVGIPLAGVLLTSETATLGWNEIFDVRAMLFTGGGVGVHGLDPSQGYHTGQLDAVDVLVADPSGNFAFSNAEDVFREIGGQLGSEVRRIARWRVPSGQTTLDLPDVVDQLDWVTVDGFLVDPQAVSLNAAHDQLTFDLPTPTGNMSVTAGYSVQTV